MFTGVTQTIMFFKQRLKQICDHPVVLTQKADENVLEGMDSLASRNAVLVMEELVSDVNYQQGLESSSCNLNFILPLLISALSSGDGS